MKPELKIEKLEKSAWSVLAGLYAQLFAVHGIFFNWNFEAAMDEFDKSESFIIKNGLHIQSFLTFRTYSDRLEIMAIGTRSDSVKQGYASALMDEVVILAAQRSIPVWLEVHEKNLQAVAFYVKNHFSILNHRKNYYADGGSALIMRSRA